MSSRPTSSAELVSGQPEMYVENLSQKKNILFSITLTYIIFMFTFYLSLFSVLVHKSVCVCVFCE